MTRLCTTGIAVACTAAAGALPWMAGPYLVDLASRALSLGVLAGSVSLLTGYAGLPTLGQVAPYATGAYVAANLAIRAGLSAPELTIASALAGVACAIITLPIMIRARGVIALMVSLAIGTLTVTVATAETRFTGGSNGMVAVVMPMWRSATPVGDDAVTYWFVLAIATSTLVTAAIVLRGRAGLLLAGLRQDELRLRVTGHPVAQYLVVTYAAAGAMAGIGGGLLVIGQTFISAGDMGFETATLVLLAVTIGGTRSMAGAVAGAALIVMTQDWLAGPWPGHGPLILGTLFIAAVYLVPDGAAALPGRIAARFPALVQARFPALGSARRGVRVAARAAGLTRSENR